MIQHIYFVQEIDQKNFFNEPGPCQGINKKGRKGVTT